MANQQLLDYIQKARHAKMSDEEIKSELKNAGWKDEQVAEGFEDPKKSIRDLKKMLVLKIGIVSIIAIVLGAGAYAGYVFIINMNV